MTRGWYWVWVLGIVVSGGLVLTSLLLAWARSTKRYWLTEMDRNGDANGKDEQ